jgi:hypothetical protein
MAIILPKRWTRQPQLKVGLDQRWLEARLNLALLPMGTSLIDCSPRNIQGSAGVRTSSSCPQGKTILRTSGSYAFAGLMQSAARFSVIAVIRPTGITAEQVICQSSSAVTTGTAQFSLLSSQLNLISGNEFIVATSSGSGLTAGRTHVVGVTYADVGGTGTTIFYIDGKKLNTTSGAAPSFVADGNGIVFVKQSGSDPFTGGLAFLADFNDTLSDAEMISLTANPWQVFAPQRPLYLADEVAAGVSGTIAVTLGNDTSVITGTTTVTGSIARTLANDTSAMTGTTTVVGSIARTLGNDTSAITGTTTITGSIAETLADDTIVASGSVGSAVSGTIAVTLANDTSSITGTTTVVGTINNTLNNDTLAASGSTPPPVNTQVMGGISHSPKRYYIERDGKKIFFTDEREVYDLLHQEEAKVVKKAKKAIKQVTKSDIAEIVTFEDFDIPKPKITFKTNDVHINKEIARINERINANYIKALMRHVELMEEEEVFIALLLG